MAEMLNVHKVVLKSGKAIYLKDPQVKDQKMAIQMVGPNDSENKLALGSRFQEAMLKVLLVQIDQKKLTGPEKEDLGALLTLTEYNQSMRAVSSLTGEEVFDPKFELVRLDSGDKSPTSQDTQA